MSEDQVPEVAVLIPARNEAASIERCLEHVLAQDIDRGRLEVVVVDGDSADATGEIARSMLEGSGLARWVVHRNRGGSTPANLNAGLALVRAPVVCRVDARSLVPPHYVRTCLETLATRPDVAVTGGAQMAVARSDSDHDRGIARALNNRYGMGLSRYRRGARSGPSDTVYLGAFRTTELRGAAGWDERFGTNQDFDLNRRMAAHGIVWFDDSIPVGYLPRASISQLFRQYQRFGRWKARYWRVTGSRPEARQVALLVGPPALIAGALVVGRRHPGLTVAGACAAAAAVDGIGGRGGGCPSVPVRAVAVGAQASVAAGWWSGVVLGLVDGALRHRRERDVS